LNGFSQKNSEERKWWRTPNPAYVDDVGTIHLRNADATFGRKMLRGSLLVHGAEALSFGLLAVLPSHISQWESLSASTYGSNFRRAYTSPPVFDKDKWYINYIGHPYQGAYFYNAVRSQDANIWQSSLFTLVHVFVWEYVIEAGLEQPSIQDIIVTPLAGILLGEGIHRATIAMAKNGFRWYEVAAVVVLNPMFALNNGFRFARR
jgi:hypothetical protein